MKTTYTQADRQELLDREDAVAFRKTARIVAVQMSEPFSVRTDRGPMEGSAGDWLATNHPDDDPGSDLWTISDERMRNTYVVDETHVFPDDKKVIVAHPVEANPTRTLPCGCTVDNNQLLMTGANCDDPSHQR